MNDTGHLHLVHSEGSLFIEEGPASGNLPGTIKVRFNVGATVTGSFTIYPRNGGSISGHGASNSLHYSGAYGSFGGTMSVSNGTGHYAHAHGGGGFYGTINRRNNALVVQTIGKLDL